MQLNLVFQHMNSIETAEKVIREHGATPSFKDTMALKAQFVLQ